VKKYQVEFIESTHQYLVDGRLTPSVSTILKETIFANKYSGVSESVLRNAAQFGTNVHKAIELSEDLFLSLTEQLVYDKWLNLVKTENIKPLEHEQVVNYHYDYAGTLDMIAEVNGVRSLCDIKTTYNIDMEYLSWQLSMYELAYGERFEKLYVIWLPKRKGAELREVPRKSVEAIQDLIEVYYETCRQ
jgi:hypothetical protein